MLKKILAEIFAPRKVYVVSVHYPDHENWNNRYYFSTEKKAEKWINSYKEYCSKFPSTKDVELFLEVELLNPPSI